MALQSFPGRPIMVGTRPLIIPNSLTTVVVDAANEAMIYIGRMLTSDGSSHTINTTGSSSIGWRSGSNTFANAGTSVSVGIAPVDTSTGPPARATNAADVITFDVKAVFPGNGGGITSTSWQTSVPTTGTKTIANGDLVAVAIQMTARAGADSVQIICHDATGNVARPDVTSFTGASYSKNNAFPNCFVTFADGAFGWFEGGEVFTSSLVRTWNSGSATKEYGQLHQFPFPVQVCGMYGYVQAAADFDVVLYSDPLGTPVAEKTVSIDLNTVSTASGAWFFESFPATYSLSANTPIGAVFKPGGTNISAYYKTLASSSHRIAEPAGTSGYGISRASGAFANANSSLDHYMIGLLLSGFGDGGGASFHATIF